MAAVPMPDYRWSGKALPSAFRQLQHEKCWVVWRYTWNGKKWDKPPLNPRTGRNASSTGAATWGTFSEAIAGLRRFGCHGIGLVIRKDDNLTAIDLDGCISESGTYSDPAARVIEAAETYCEISPSGLGVRALTYSSAPFALLDSLILPSASARTPRPDGEISQ